MEAKSERLRVAVVATWTGLTAARGWIPRTVRPFDCRLVAQLRHAQARFLSLHYRVIVVRCGIVIAHALGAVEDVLLDRSK